METYVMNAEETLQKLFEVLKKKDVTYNEAIEWLTVTQKTESEFVGKNNVHGHISGIHSLVILAKDIKIKQKFITNQVMKDFIITFVGEREVKMKCRLVKESEVRKTSKSGSWGVNASSFKLIK